MINFSGGLINAGGLYINPDKVRTFRQTGNSLSYKTEVTFDNGDKELFNGVTSGEFAAAFIKSQAKDDFKEYRVVDLKSEAKRS